MFNVVVEIKVPEIVDAIKALIGALTNAKTGNASVQATPIMAPQTLEQPQQVLPQQQFQQMPQQQIPVQQPLQQPVQSQPQPQQIAPQQMPMQPQQAPQQPMAPQVNTAVPTATAPTYTMEQLAVAATQLMDAGRKDDLLKLLGSFGVQALTMLPKEQYGNFATQLRAMGAKI